MSKNDHLSQGMMNSKIASVFQQIGDILEITGGNPFKIRSYRNAVTTVENLAQPLEEMVANKDDLTSLQGIGKALSSKIVEIVETGTCAKLTELKQNFPPNLVDLLQVRGLGAKKVKVLYEKLDIKDLDELKQAAQDGKISGLPGMGKKTEDNILKSLETLASESGRVSIAQASRQVQAIGAYLDSIKSITRWQPAGSFRRRRESIGDLDILILSTDRAKTSKDLLAFSDIQTVTGQGEEKISVVMENGFQVDFRFFEEESFGAAMMYFTGSKAHNIEMRKRAIKMNRKLNEYGLYEDDKKLVGATEEEVYKALNLEWIAPEMREDRGEIAWVEKNGAMDLIELGDIKGELHAHSTASDGQNSILELVTEAKKRGYQYIAVTDHSKAVAMVGGLDEARLLEQKQDIDEINATLEDFLVLSGIEVDILKDGSLDIEERVLKQLNWVVASVHSNFGQDRDTMTKRLLTAINSGAIQCLGHPLTRLIGKRDPIQFEVQKVFEACQKMNVFLEINAQPERLDLPDTFCKQAKEMGIKMVVTTDAHQLENMDLMQYGIGVARRGWLTKDDVVNAQPLAELRRTLGI